MLGRPLPARHVLCLLLALGCAGRSTRDSGAAAPDDSPPEAVIDAQPPPRPDSRIGLAGGSSCDSSAQCLSGACTLGVCSDWSRALRIDVDTSASGANLAQGVTDFPLLVRLRATNFTFTEANSDGADLRFVDRTGHSLSHEIEHWNQPASLGDVWVLVPRIEASRVDNYILMYWGNPQAAPVSSGPSVFADSDCVLHMVAAADAIDAHLQDSSGQDNRGILELEHHPHEMPPEGIAGLGLKLDGTGDFLATSSLLMSPSTFAISLWLKTTSTHPAGIAGFLGNSPGEKVQFDRAIWMDASGRLSFGVLRTTSLVKVSSLTSYNDGAWHHVVARSSDNGQYLFVDGESIADDPTRSGTNSFKGSWRFGQDPAATPLPAENDAALPPAGYLAGTLDEIRIASREPSDAWIKLAYATQRPDTTAIRYQHLP